MAAEAPEDRFAGLAPDELLFRGEPADLDLDDGGDPDPAALKERALAAEDAARAVEGVTNSDGGSASASASIFALATSHGFSGAYPRHRLQQLGQRRRRRGRRPCSATMPGIRRATWPTSKAAGEIGTRAAERAVARLNPVSVKPGVMPVLFDPRVATTLLGHFVAAISGSAIARQASFLLDALGDAGFRHGHHHPRRPVPQARAAQPRVRRRGASGPANGPGQGRRADDLAGRQRRPRASSASSRPAMRCAACRASPGAGPSNLHIAAGKRSREEMIAGIKQGILVTELIGQGVNGVTGDYSRGAAGFLIIDGEIGPAVAEITIASNLKQMFATLEPASDLSFRRGIDSPTLLVPEMTRGLSALAT